MKQLLRPVALLGLLALLLSGCTDAPSDDTTAATVDLGMTALSEEVLMDKLKGGWIGQMVGVAWAASTEFSYQGKLMLSSYMPTWTPGMINDAFDQDDVYVEIPFMEALAAHGVNCDGSYLADAFRDSGFDVWHANLAARNNLRQGINYPDSGSYLYSAHADDIDWQIECDFLGMMYPGMVNSAAQRAFELGHIMNYGDGVYGGVFMSAMHAAAFTAGSIEEIWRAGLAVIPEGTQFRQLLEDVVASYEAGDSFEANWRNLERKWNTGDLCPDGGEKYNIDAKLNAGYVLMGLLYGEGDFAKTIIYATRCGQDSDCNPSSAASILGSYYGASALDELYTGKLDETSKLFSETSYTFTQAVEMNFQLMQQAITAAGGKAHDGTWYIPVEQELQTVPYEQWPDGLYVYYDLSSFNNTVYLTSVQFLRKNASMNSYTVDMGDGTVFQGSVPESHTYAEPGTYCITFTLRTRDGAEYPVQRTVTVQPSDVQIICDVMQPQGGGSKNLGVICDGIQSLNQKGQYDTYVGNRPAADRQTYIGYLYPTARTVSQVQFTEGLHYGDGGWFADGSLKLQLQVDGQWVDAKCSISPDYPVGNSQAVFGSNGETYTFCLETPVECTGVRLTGIAGGAAGFISIAELAVE